MSDDSRLIRAASAGDHDAFGALVRRRQARVFWTALQIVGNEEDARDVVQEVFIRLWRVLPRYKAERSFTTWLYRITVNLAIDAHRRRQVRPDQQSSAPVETSEVAQSGASADAIGQNEIQQIFLHLARRLSAQQRAVFVLKEMNDMDSSDIAKVLDISPSTVRNHLHQARKSLRRGLATHYPEYAALRRPEKR